jgi:Ca2+-transporting ATPase
MSSRRHARLVPDGFDKWQSFRHASPMSHMPLRHSSATSPAADRLRSRAPSSLRTSRPWHELDSSVVLQELKSDAALGLTTAEGAQRLSHYGRNELEARGLKSPWLIVWEQLTALMVLILIAAASLSTLLGDYSDSIAIGAIVVLNVLLGFVQEYRAEKAILALNKLAVPHVRVRRDAHVQEISSPLVVPGDVLFVEAGDFVPADCRILESANLQTQEASLTGESQPVRKTDRTLPDSDRAIADRRNMMYMGTFVTNGHAQAVVTETGMRTELGGIAQLIRGVERAPTPLQRRLNQLAKTLAAAALAIVTLIFVLGLLRGEPLKLMFLAAVSLGVAAVPEGLPAVATIALTLGAQRMLKRKALIRKLSAVEALGSVNVICSDKTGTLTENRMAVAVFELADRTVQVRERLRGKIQKEDEPSNSGLGLLLMTATLCNDAVMQPDPKNPSEVVASGDPTEAALLVAALQFGVQKNVAEQILPRAGEVSFSSERKRMTTIQRIPFDLSLLPPAVRFAMNGGSPSFVAFTKGSVEALLPLCRKAWINGKAETLEEGRSQEFLAANNALAANGMRILGTAFRFLDSLPEEVNAQDIERDLTFVGMVGILDPPRFEAAAAVSVCKKAGIRPVMVTGDHPLTARYIAAELGIMKAEPFLTGPEIDKLTPAELQLRSESVPLYARVSPEHKLKIVASLQRSGHIVAMTGDGVNDAPALKKADIGLAMGLTGTDVAKAAADVVLLDDNFATIVDAVEEGRVIYDNIRKFVKYILATNSAEIWVMLAAPFFGMPLALLPLQILWMNLMTDGLPALALSAEPPESDIMRRPPHPPSESLFARGMGRHVIWVGLLMGLLSLGLGYGYWRANDPNWQTMIFTTLTFSQMAHVLAIRSERRSLFRIGLFSNKPLLAAVSLTIVLQLILLYVSELREVFRTTPLSALDLARTAGLATVIFCAVEFEKWMLNRKTTQLPE